MAEQEKEEYLFKNFTEYREYLNTAPKDNWIQKRSLGGNKVHDYIPLFIIQANGDLVFREWNVIEEQGMTIQNGVAFTVKIFALPDYPDSEYITFTGSAAVLFKSSKNAVEFDLPNARERAIGKAFSTLGNTFGRNLNRSYMVNRNNKEEKVIVKQDFSFIDFGKTEG